MYCSHCGKEIADVDICPLCGCYARNAAPAPVQVQAPVAPAAPAVSRPLTNGKGTAARFWGKTFCILGALGNLLLIFIDNPEHYMHNYVGAFENLYYYLAGVIAAMTIIGAAFMFFNKRRTTFKKYIPIPAVLGLLALAGGVYGIVYEFYSPAHMTVLFAIAGMVLTAMSAILLMASMISRLNLLNLFALIADLAGCGMFYIFFGRCMINGYYRAERFFLVSLLDLAGLAIVMLLLTGAYNSDMKFDKAHAPEKKEVASNE